MIREAEQALPAGADREDRAAWLAARRRGIGASDVSAILGLSPYRCARDVYDDKLTEPRGEDGSPSEAAHWGVLLEPLVRDEWARRTGITVALAGMHRSTTPHREFMLCSPDGICSDGGLYEGKAMSLRQGEQWADGQVPDHAELQVQHGMEVLGLDHAWVAGLIGGQELIWRRVPRDDELIEILVKAEYEFWHDHVIAGIPPRLGGSAAESGWLADAYPVAAPESTVELDRFTAERLRADYRAAKAVDRDNSGALDAAKNAIRDAMGDAETAVCDGDVIATWKNHGNAFDETAFRAQCPELAAQYATTVEVIDRTRLAADEPQTFRRFRNRVLKVK